MLPDRDMQIYTHVDFCDRIDVAMLHMVVTLNSFKTETKKLIVSIIPVTWLGVLYYYFLNKILHNENRLILFQ